MGIKANFKKEDVRKHAISVIDNILDGLVETIYLSSTQIVSLAKNTDTYIDRTNNLRSSIGFVIYHNGEPVRIGDFEQTGIGNEGRGEKGIRVGPEVAKEIAENYSKGIVVVIVAGMHYALYVESMGYDVLTSSALQFPQIFKEYAEGIKDTGIELNDTGENNINRPR